MPIHQDRHWAAATSVVVSNPLDVFVLIFLCWRLRRHCRFFGTIVKPLTPRHCLRSLVRVVYSSSSANISVVIAESSGLSYFSDATAVVVNSLGPESTLPDFSIRDVHAGTLSLLLPPPTHLLSLSSPRDHLPLLTPPSLLPIPQAHHCNAATSVVVPKSLPPQLFSPIPRTRLLFIVLRWRLHCHRWFRRSVSVTPPTQSYLPLPQAHRL